MKPPRSGSGEVDSLERLAIVGLGAVGSQLAARLVERGQPCPRLWNRHSARAHRLAERLGGQSFETLERLVEGGEALLIAVSDDAIGELAGRLAGLPRLPRVALHLSGASSPAVLAPLAARGVAVGVFHPLSPMPANVARPGRLSAVALRGDPEALRLGKHLAAALAAQVFELEDDDPAQARYHAACVLVANGLVALFDQALCVARGSFVEPERATAAFVELARSGLAELAESTPEAAQTGPVRRGALALIERHIEVLQAAPLALDLYKSLSRVLLELARPQLGPDQQSAIAALFAEPPAPAPQPSGSSGASAD